MATTASPERFQRLQFGLQLVEFGKSFKPFIARIGFRARAGFPFRLSFKPFLVTFQSGIKCGIELGVCGVCRCLGGRDRAFKPFRLVTRFIQFDNLVLNRHLDLGPIEVQADKLRTQKGQLGTAFSAQAGGGAGLLLTLCVPAAWLLLLPGLFTPGVFSGRLRGAGIPLVALVNLIVVADSPRDGGSNRKRRDPVGIEDVEVDGFRIVDAGNRIELGCSVC